MAGGGLTTETFRGPPALTGAGGATGSGGWFVATLFCGTVFCCGDCRKYTSTAATPKIATTATTHIA